MRSLVAHEHKIYKFLRPPFLSLFFFLNDAAPPEISPLPLPAALPICDRPGARDPPRGRRIEPRARRAPAHRRRSPRPPPVVGGRPRHIAHRHLPASHQLV